MAHIQLRIKYEDKQEAQAVLDSLGLTMSSAIKLFLKQVVREQALPFTVSAEKPKKEMASESALKQTNISNNNEHKTTWNGFSVKKIG